MDIQDLCKIISFWNEVLIPVAARCKAWVCGSSLAGIVGSNHGGGMDVSLVVRAVESVHKTSDFDSDFSIFKTPTPT
jgi:hypothetical protein